MAGARCASRSRRLQFTAALKEAFDHIVYPSINSALRATGIDLAFAGNQSGEATIRKTLEGAQKFTTKIDDDSFRSRAEARLFGSAESKVVLWSDFKRAAAVNTNWPLHKTSALDDLKAECLRRGLWREEGNHIRRGPFPPPVPEVAIRELSVQEDGDGHTFLKIEPLHAPCVVYETGDSDPTQRPVLCRRRPALKRQGCVTDSSPSIRMILLAIARSRNGPRNFGSNTSLHNRGDHYEVELLALPKANRGLHSLHHGRLLAYQREASPPMTGRSASRRTVASCARWPWRPDMI